MTEQLVDNVNAVDVPMGRDYDFGPHVLLLSRSHIHRSLTEVHMRSETPVVVLSPDWMASYRAANAERLKTDTEFARWLESDYVPIAGGWQY